MYRFRSSDITNDKFIAAVEKYGQVIIDHYKKLDIREICEIIYHSELNENMYNNLMFALTVSDEFILPATKSEADVLFFVLQVNYAYTQRESKIQIRTVSQAYMYIEQSNGHFKEILKDNAPETFTTGFTCFCPKVPNIAFDWRIPTTHIMDGETKQARLCIAGACDAPYAFLSFPLINVHNLQIPRMYYMQLFRDGISKGNIFSDETTLRTMASQTMTKELFTQILNYCGFKHFYNIKKANIFETIYWCDENNGLIYAEAAPTRNGIEDSQYLLLEDRDYDFTIADLQLENKERVVKENQQTIDDLKAYWKRHALNEYNFLTEAVQYLPIFDGEDWIEIWLAK